MSARRFAGAKGGPVPLYIPVLLVSVTSVVILSTDLYTPSLPHLPAYFGTDAATVVGWSSGLVRSPRTRSRTNISASGTMIAKMMTDLSRIR